MCTCNSMELMLKVDLGRTELWSKYSPNENMMKFYLANVDGRRKLVMSLIMKHDDFHVENPDIGCSVYPKFKPCHVSLLDPVEALQNWAVNHEECDNKHLCIESQRTPQLEYEMKVWRRGYVCHSRTVNNVGKGKMEYNRPYHGYHFDE